jgi:hypothetical protein
MLINRFQSATTRCVCPVVVRISLALVILCADSSPLGDSSPQRNQQAASLGHHVVVLVDTNPHQKKVLSVELSLAEGVMQKLNQPGNVFTVITFGMKAPSLLKSAVPADAAIVAIRDVTVEQTTEKYFSVRFYDALNLAINQFTDDPRSKSLLLISEGNDYFPRKTFKETVAGAQQLRFTCNAAMVADHTLYGTKGIQRYGFDLRRFVGKTHGRYVEVGGKAKKVPRSVDRLSESILNQDRVR